MEKKWRQGGEIVCVCARALFDPGKGSHLRASYLKAEIRDRSLTLIKRAAVSVTTYNADDYATTELPANEPLHALTSGELACFEIWRILSYSRAIKTHIAAPHNSTAVTIDSNKNRNSRF